MSYIIIVFGMILIVLGLSQIPTQDPIEYRNDSFVLSDGTWRITCTDGTCEAHRMDAGQKPDGHFEMVTWDTVKRKEK